MSQLRRRSIKIAKFGVKIFLQPADAKRELKSFYENRKSNRTRAVSYRTWIKGHYPSEEELKRQQAESAKFKHQPLISVILPIYNTNPKHLRLCIESVISQSY